MGNNFLNGVLPPITVSAFPVTGVVTLSQSIMVFKLISMVAPTFIEMLVFFSKMSLTLESTMTAIYTCSKEILTSQNSWAESEDLAFTFLLSRSKLQELNITSMISSLVGE